MHAPHKSERERGDTLVLSREPPVYTGAMVRKNSNVGTKTRTELSGSVLSDSARSQAVLNCPPLVLGRWFFGCVIALF